MHSDSVLNYEVLEFIIPEIWNFHLAVGLLVELVNSEIFSPFFKQICSFLKTSQPSYFSAALLSISTSSCSYVGKKVHCGGRGEPGLDRGKREV